VNTRAKTTERGKEEGKKRGKEERARKRKKGKKKKKKESKERCDLKPSNHGIWALKNREQARKSKFRGSQITRCQRGTGET